MSSFLGPIHHWLYNKIKVVESRRDGYISALKKKHGAEAAGIIEELDKDYGAKLDGQALEQMIGNNPIHGFLHSLVQKVEGGEGKLVAAAIKKFNGDAFNLFLEASEKHGRDTGERALKEKNASDPSTEAVSGLLNDYLLEGMPCDQAAYITPKSKNAFELGHKTCLHHANWKAVGAPFMEMCCFTNAWIGGFVKAVQPKMTYESKASIASGDPGCLAEFNAE
jgi:hypothetical protein